MQENAGFVLSIEVLENLKKAVVEYDGEGAVSWARKAVEEGADPVKAADALAEAAKQVGDAFGRGELWLPDLVATASVMEKAMPVVLEAMERRGQSRRTLGTVVAGTVFGDIHSIGKSMVVAMARTSGFDVVDLGVDVTAQKFLEAVKEYKADILAMSALLTTTMYEQKKVVEALKKAGTREKTKVVVGGGAITQEFADKIGADGYRATAPMAAELFKELMRVR